jgi:serine/threonine protein kinase
MNLKLHICLPDNTTRVADLTNAVLPCMIGRDSELALVPIADHQASRAHCAILRDGDQVMVEDKGSRNGTYLNGRRITKAPVRHGDILRLGKTHVTLEIGEGKLLDPLVGQRLGGFELQEVIGKGRYGTVFKALQVALSRQVAVKVLSEEYRSQPDRVQSFLGEARRAGRLNHPNLVQVHDVCQVGDNYLLVMELMKCSTTDLLRENGPLDEPTALRIMLHLARALSYAESQRLVHRDVKPDNILMNDEGVFKLADLGIAAPIASDGMAQQDRIFGSPHYVAPEQARGGAIDGRADLYALGASVWHLVTGNPLFSGNNRQVVLAHMNSPVPSLAKLAPRLAKGTAAIICRLLEKDPKSRPGNAGELAALIEPLIKQPPPASAVRTPVAGKPQRVRRRRRFH